MIHQYRMGGYNIVLDTCSGSIHSVDEVAYDIISMYPENSREDIAKSILEKYVHRDDVTAVSYTHLYSVSPVIHFTCIIICSFLPVPIAVALLHRPLSLPDFLRDAPWCDPAMRKYHYPL